MRSISFSPWSDSCVDRSDIDQYRSFTTNGISINDEPTVSVEVPAMFPTCTDEITIKAFETPFFLDVLCDPVA